MNIFGTLNEAISYILLTVTAVLIKIPGMYKWERKGASKSS